MKTEFLKELGLEKEAIDKVMAENGKDIAREQAKYAEMENVQKQLESVTEQLNTANKTIEGFGDVESIKSQVEQYKTQAAQFQGELEKVKGEYETRLKDMEYDRVLNEHFDGIQFTTKYAKDGIFRELKEKGLPLENGKIIGFNEAFGAIKEAQPGAFLVEQKKEAARVADFGAQHNQTPANDTDAHHAFNSSIIAALEGRS